MLAEVIAFCNANQTTITSALGAAGAVLGGRRLAIRRAAINFARRKAEREAVEREAARPIADEGGVGAKSLRVLRRALNLGVGAWSLHNSGNYVCQHPDYVGVMMWWFDQMPRKHRVGKSRWKYHIGRTDVTYLMTNPERLYLVAFSDAIREQIGNQALLATIAAMPANVAGFLKEQLSIVEGWAINDIDHDSIARTTPFGLRIQITRHPRPFNHAEYKFYIGGEDVTCKMSGAAFDTIHYLVNDKFAQLPKPQAVATVEALVPSSEL